MIWTTTIYWSISYYNFCLSSKYKYATSDEITSIFFEKNPGSNCPSTVSYLIILYCRIEVTFGSFQSLKIYQSNQRYKISNTKYLGSPHSILGAIFLRVAQITPPGGNLGHSFHLQLTASYQNICNAIMFICTNYSSQLT